MTVICIDDNPATRALTVRALAKAGFSVQSGGSAEAAINLASTAGEDLALILLDINMPGASGYDALQVIKADKGLQNIPVLMLSATAEPEKARLKAKKLGAVELLTYPISDKELVTAVRDAIARRTFRDTAGAGGAP